MLFYKVFDAHFSLHNQRHSPCTHTIEHTETHRRSSRCIRFHCRHKSPADDLQRPGYPYLRAIALEYLNRYATDETGNCNRSEAESADSRRDGVRVLAPLEINWYKI